MDFFNQFNTNQKKQEQTQFLYEDLKIGDLVVICGMKHSPYNVYKGYVGYVKDYRKQNKSAIISLNAPATPKIIQVPLEHFQKI